MLVQQAAGGKGNFVHSHVTHLLADLAAQGVRHPARYDEFHLDLSGPQYTLGLQVYRPVRTSRSVIGNLAVLAFCPLVASS